MISKRSVLTGVVLDEQIELTLSDLCQSCSVERERIFALVEEGILTPIIHAADQKEYRFSGSSVRRAVRAIRIQRDLELNLAGVAVALDLLEEIERLRARLCVYES